MREWRETVCGYPEQARHELRLDKEIAAITIVKRELLRHEPTDPELERYIRIHWPDLAADLPVTGDNRRFFLALHKQYADQFQQPPLTVEIDRDGKPLTINRLARILVGSPVLAALGDRFTGDAQLIWKYATSAVGRKLGVPSDGKLADGSDWDSPQTHAIIRRPEVQRELFSYVLGRLIDEGHCPALDKLRQHRAARDAA